MKKTLLMLLSLLAMSETMICEEPKFTPDEVYPFGVGLFVAAKGGVNTMDSPDGIKNGFSFGSMPDIGAQLYVPFGLTSNLGATLELGYISFMYKFREYNNEQNSWGDKCGFFTISPNVHISGFIIGFNLGIPVSASSGNNISGNKYTYDYKTDNLGFLVDIHVGGLIPLYKDETGRLNLIIQGEYPFSAFFKNNLAFDNSSVSRTPTFNVQPVALKLGLSYIYNSKLLQK